MFFRSETLLKFGGALLFLCFIGLILLIPKWYPPSSVCSQDYANYGQWISGVVGLIGVPFIVLTLSQQTRAIKAEDSEKTFERYCKSIEIGLSFIKNRDNSFHGGGALIRYGDLCISGKLTIDDVSEELSISALKSVVASLSDLLEWVKKGDNLLLYHSFFRVRFMSLIMAFEKMLPEGVRGMSKSDLFRTYGKKDENEKYALLLSINRLIDEEYDVWIEYEIQHEKRLGKSIKSPKWFDYVKVLWGKIGNNR